MIRPVGLAGSLILCSLLFMLAACGGGGGGGGPVNSPPTAAAGDDRTITLDPGVNAATVTLSGSGTDSDGTVTGYRWTGSPDPEDVASPTVTLGAGTHVFTLIVTDDKGAESPPARVTITVIATPFTKAEYTFSITLPESSPEQIGSANLTLTLPPGVALPAAGAIPPDRLKFSGAGLDFVALENARATIIGSYSPPASGRDAVVTIGVTTLTDAGQGMPPGIFATLVCDLVTGTEIDMGELAPLADVVIGSASGVKIYDPLSNVQGPAAASYTITLK